MSSHVRRVVALLAALAAFVPSAALAADTAAPRIAHVPVTEAMAGAPLKVAADIVDESEIFEPKLHYRPQGTGRFYSMSLVLEAGSTFSTTIPDAATKADLEYFIEAYDAHGNGPARFASESAPQVVRVRAAPPPPPPPALSASTEPAAAEEKPPSTTEAAAPAFRPPLYAAGIAAGVGAAAAGVGAYFGSRVLDGSVDLEGSRGAATGANVCFGVAAVAAAAAAALAIWHFVPGDRADSERPEFGLFVGPAGFAAAGRF